MSNSETSTFYIAKICSGKIDPHMLPSDASSIMLNISNNTSHTNFMKIHNVASGNSIFFHSITNSLETVQGSQDLL